LKGPISWAEVAIEQLCYFFSRARSLDLVQRSQDMLVEMVVQHLAPHAFAVLGLEGRPAARCSFVFDLAAKKTAGREEPVGANWKINLRIASGVCSPTAPEKV